MPVCYFTLAVNDSSGLWAEEPCLKIGERLLKKAWPSKNKHTNFRAEEASPKESFIGPLRWKRRKTLLILCMLEREDVREGCPCHAAEQETKSSRKIESHTILATYSTSTYVPPSGLPSPSRLRI